MEVKKYKGMDLSYKTTNLSKIREDVRESILSGTELIPSNMIGMTLKILETGEPMYKFGVWSVYFVNDVIIILDPEGVWQTTDSDLTSLF